MASHRPMRDCVACSQPLREELKFCTRCGNPTACGKCGRRRLPREVACPDDGEVFALRDLDRNLDCAKCGARWKTDSRFCVNCGSPRKPDAAIAARSAPSLLKGAVALAVVTLTIVASRAVHRRMGPSGPDPAVQAYGQGNAAFSERAFDAAIDRYSEALRAKPDFSAAHLKRGLAKFALERYDEAFSDIQTAIHTDASSSEAYFARGTLLWVQGKPDEAARDFYQAIELDPSDKAYYDRLATALYEAKRDPEVDGVYQRAYEADPSRDWALWGWLQAVADQGQFDSLRSLCKRLERPGSASAAIVYHRGLLAQHDGNHHGVAHNFKFALRLDPDRTPAYAYQAVAKASRQLGRTAEYEEFSRLYKERTGLDVPWP